MTDKKQISSTTKQVIAVLVSLVLVGLVYYGSYLPYKKSRSFINNLRNIDRMGTFDDVKRNFNEVYAISAPIGHEELVRHFSNIALQTVQQTGRENPDLAQSVIAYVEEIYAPILENGRGMSFNQNLFILGAINQVAFLQTGNEEYLEKGIQYFERGNELAPQRPQFLYGLFDLYRLSGQTDKAIDMGEQIISLWPNDERIQVLLGELKGAANQPA